MTTDQTANVTAQANYDDAVSGEEITWVNAVAAATGSLYTGAISFTTYGSQVAAANNTRNAAIQTDNVTRVTAIGTAEVTEATNLGTAGNTLAGGIGSDEQSLVSGLAGVANTLATQEQTADTTFVSTKKKRCQEPFY